MPLNDNLTFAPFHISFKGGWLDTHHFAEEGGELAQVDLLWISSLFIFWNLVFVTVVHLPGCRRSEGDGVGGEACTGRGGGDDEAIDMEVNLQIKIWAIIGLA